MGEFKPNSINDIKKGDTMGEFKPNSINDIKKGMEVVFTLTPPNDREREVRGKVKYVGPIEKMTGHFIGVELNRDQVPLPLTDIPTNGTMNGVPYFTCDPGRGFFIGFNQVKRCYRSPSSGKEQEKSE